MNENHQLFHRLETYRKKSPAGFEKAVGYLLTDGLEAAFERLEASPFTPAEIRSMQNPPQEAIDKLEAFYACIQARNILGWQDKEDKGYYQIPKMVESDSQIDDEDEYPDESPPDEVV